MEQPTSPSDPTRHLPDRKPWEEPRIVLEQPLEIMAFGPPDPPGHSGSRRYLSPLTLSGNNPFCNPVTPTPS